MGVCVCLCVFVCVCASFGKLFDFPVFLLDPGPILNIINFNFQCVLYREPAHQYTAAALTQMPDCISTNEVKKFCFFNKQHEKFTANYILAKAMIILKNDLTRKNLSRVIMEGA